jgi:hypothetical protein
LIEGFLTAVHKARYYERAAGDSDRRWSRSTSSTYLA